MIELDDIQGMLIHGRTHGFARYHFLTITDPIATRKWLTGILNDITTAQPAPRGHPSGYPVPPCINAAFTFNGLGALGLAPDALASFPEEFRAGMPQRAALLGDTGSSAPAHWEGGLASPDLHAVLLLFASNAQELEAASARFRDDFIDKAADGLNAIWSHCDDFPPGGARDREAFKAYIRAYEYTADVFYSAYPDASVKDIHRALRIRQKFEALLDEFQ